MPFDTLPDMPGETTVCVEDVRKSYPRTRRLRELLLRPLRTEWQEALRGVDLRVQGGTIHGLLGANGAGKTTLLKILATLVLPSSGRVTVDGLDLATEPARVRERIGLVAAEERSFYWRLTGRDNLLFFAALHDLHGAERARRVDEVLDVVGLTEDQHRAFREYSSGLRQRLAIARGLLSEPRILLLDEPTRTLDPPAAAWIRKFVRERLVEDRGTTAVLATHDLMEAETTCDRISLIGDGVVVADGTVEELKRPLDGAARTRIVLLAPGEELLRRLRAGELGDVTVDAEPGRCTLRVRGGEAEVAAWVERLVHAGGRVSAVRAEEVDLARLFDAVTRAAPENAGGAP